MGKDLKFTGRGKKNWGKSLKSLISKKTGTTVYKKTETRIEIIHVTITRLPVSSGQDS